MKTITTIEHLEALPDRAVIKAADETILFCIGSGQPDWDGNVWQDEESRWIGSHDIDPPAALLHPLIFTAEDVEMAVALYRDAYSSAWRNDGEALPIASAILAVLASIGEVQG